MVLEGFSNPIILGMTDLQLHSANGHALQIPEGKPPMPGGTKEQVALVLIPVKHYVFASLLLTFPC